MRDMTDSSILSNRSVSRELLAIQRELQRTRQALGRLGGDARDASQQMSLFGQRTTQAMQTIVRDARQLQSEMQKLKQELGELGKTSVKPTVDVEDKASGKWKEIGKKLLEKKELVLNLLIGTDLKGIASDAEQAAKERRLYATKGNKTDADMAKFDQDAKVLINKNPELGRAQAMSLVSQGEQLYGKQGSKYAVNSARLAYTTGQDSKELLKLMAEMRDATKIDDADRIGNSLQHMMNKGKNLDINALSSLIKNSKQTGQVLDTPEKIAAMVNEMGKIGVLSMDKGFESLKEATNQLSNSGELEKILQTGYEAVGENSTAAKEKAGREAKEVEQLLTSGSKADVQHAMGKLLQAFASVKDEKARTKMQELLGKDAGKEMLEKFGPILDAAGRLATGENRPQVARNELDRSYENATKHDSFFTYRQTQNDARQSVVDLGGKIIGDVLPIIRGLSHVVKWLADLLASMPDLIRQGIEVALVGLAAKKFFFGKKEDGDGSAETKTTAKEGNCCCQDAGGEPQKGRKKKRRGRSTPKPNRQAPQPSQTNPKRTWWNPTTWGKKGGADSGETSAKKGLFGGIKEKLTAFIPGKETLTRGLTAVKTAGPRALEWMQKAAPRMGKALPFAGTAIGLASALTAKDKKDGLLRFGAESLGGMAGGALAGAAVGSVIPVVGTAIGGIVGGALGAWGGGALYDSVKGWFSKSSHVNERDVLEKEKRDQRAAASGPTAETPMSPADRVKQLGVPLPPQSPAKKPEEKPKTVSLTIPQMPITINAEGILQDEAGLLKMLNKGSIGTQIIKLVEKGMVDAMQTRGGVASGRVGGVPV